ncbi:hypothetical protein CS006_02885 [Bifidobacterium primatium]|uniref:Uncharacterized protein n=1 Tax=Bifidobacterium primatium TaxID=2045438 RepID=A0A2M9HBA5_9BIFI|nr:hypothetical protein [Bifidobacterium primatium]PJM74102.1 hypothetical protein CS006_02885 [Bifidobacterium primatium]
MAVESVIIDPLTLRKRRRLPERRGYAEPLITLIPSVVFIDDMPGSLGLRRMVDDGTLSSLDEGSAYMARDSATLYGRAAIADCIVPFGSIAAGLLASWIWLGGPFPERIDLISGSHYRALAYGRQVRVFHRQTTAEQVMKLGKLRVTSPVRTICDLACMDAAGRASIDVDGTIVRLLAAYAIPAALCLQTLWDNQRWPNHGEGVETLTRILERQQAGAETNRDHDCATDDGRGNERDDTSGDGSTS